MMLLSSNCRNDSYQKMLLFLAQSEYAMDKNLQVFNMNLKEQEKYEKLNQTIGMCKEPEIYTQAVVRGTFTMQNFQYFSMC